LRIRYKCFHSLLILKLKCSFQYVYTDGIAVDLSDGGPPKGTSSSIFENRISFLASSLSTVRFILLPHLYFLLNPQSPVPSPQSPVPSPQSPAPVPSPQSPVPSPQSPAPVPSLQSPVPSPIPLSYNNLKLTLHPFPIFTAVITTNQFLL
jgi:hypothetical protein